MSVNGRPNLSSSTPNDKERCMLSSYHPGLLIDGFEALPASLAKRGGPSSGPMPLRAKRGSAGEKTEDATRRKMLSSPVAISRDSGRDATPDKARCAAEMGQAQSVHGPSRGLGCNGPEFIAVHSRKSTGSRCELPLMAAIERRCAVSDTACRCEVGETFGDPVVRLGSRVELYRGIENTGCGVPQTTAEAKVIFL